MILSQKFMFYIVFCVIAILSVLGLSFITMFDLWSVCYDMASFIILLQRFICIWAV